MAWSMVGPLKEQTLEDHILMSCHVASRRSKHLVGIRSREVEDRKVVFARDETLEFYSHK